MKKKSANKNFTDQKIINAKPSVVFEQLTSISALQQWWENPVEGSSLLGSKLRFGFEESEEYSLMCITELNEPYRLLWTVEEDTGFNGEWIGTKILFQLKHIESDKCELLFQHIGLTPELVSYEPCISGWHHYLSNIKNLSEEKNGTIK